ncbi:hypothetical protein MAE02_45870 [Microvirga aerophila]|uniref:DUF1190 domain-containing protein n=2 Tax=Microvirga aerophila TaxID=670291 RepID=A0A512BY61_9HYPH|nr:hypothetical protein MAE02_45870 [Microvirga aerophila]
MQRCRTYALPAFLALSGLVLDTPASQASTRTATYVTSQACQTQGLLSADECQNAFANAEAEFEDEAPVFDKQDECERHFRRCVISFSGVQQSSKVLRYVPRMKGVRVTVSAQQGRTVVPVLESHHPAVSFSSRTVQDLRDARSPLRQQDSQTRWAAFQRRLEGSTPALRGTLDGVFHQNTPEPRFASLAPKLIEWCKRFCGSLPVGGHQSLAAPQSGTGLFSPNIDVGPHPEGPVETSRFSRQNASGEQAKPRFVQKSDAAINSIVAGREADVRPSSD